MKEPPAAESEFGARSLRFSSAHLRASMLSSLPSTATITQPRFPEVMVDLIKVQQNSTLTPTLYLFFIFLAEEDEDDDDDDGFFILWRAKSRSCLNYC